MTDVEEAEFFESYGQLSKALGKVTVASIQDSREESGTECRKFIWFGPRVRISEAHFAVNSFRRQSIVALALLLVVQIYWVWGSALVENLREIEKQSAELTALDAKELTGPNKESETGKNARDTAADMRRDEEGNLDVKFVTLDRLLRTWNSVWGALGHDEI